MTQHSAKPRSWNLPLTYEPKIQPVIKGDCNQTIRTLDDHKCKTCEGTGRLSAPTTLANIQGIHQAVMCQKCNGTGIRKAIPKKVGDRIRFYRWTGRPYWSKPEHITGYMPIILTLDANIRPQGMWIENPIIPALSTLGQGIKKGMWFKWSELKWLAKCDGIIPPTGEALRDVLISKNGRIPDGGIRAQIIRWDPMAGREDEED